MWNKQVISLIFVHQKMFLKNIRNILFIFNSKAYAKIAEIIMSIVSIR